MVLLLNLELKNQKQCPKCYKQIDKEAKFCPYCGEKQETVITKEAEILEDVDFEEGNFDTSFLEVKKQKKEKLL